MHNGVLLRCVTTAIPACFKGIVIENDYKDSQSILVGHAEQENFIMFTKKNIFLLCHPHHRYSNRSLARDTNQTLLM